MKDFGAVCRDVRFREVGVSTVTFSSHFFFFFFFFFVFFFILQLLDGFLLRINDPFICLRPHSKHYFLHRGLFITHFFPSSQIHEIHHKVRPESVELLRRDYTANGGWETFLSYEDPEKDILVGLLRLRKCSDEGTFRSELVKKDGDEGGCSIVRELHVYGTAVPVHGRDPTKFQHQVCPWLLTSPLFALPLQLVNV